MTCAYTTHTCHRCRRRESTQCPLRAHEDSSAFYIKAGPRPAGWSAALGYTLCDSCTALVKTVIEDGSVGIGRAVWRIAERSKLGMFDRIALRGLLSRMGLEVRA